MSKKLIVIVIIVVLISSATFVFAFTDIADIFGISWNPSNSVDETFQDNIKDTLIIPENVIVVDDYRITNSMQKSYSKTGNSLAITKIMREGTKDNPQYIYSAPIGIDVDGNNNIYIADVVNKVIRSYSSDINVKNVSYSGVSGYKEPTDFRVNKVGDIYLLFDDALYSCTTKSDSFQKIVYGFNDAHQLRISNNGDLNVLDFNYENMNLRVQVFDTTGRLMKTKEQYSYDMGLFDYTDNEGNVITVSPLGGNCYDELQYAVSSTKYHDNKYLISFKPADKEHYVRGVSVIGVDNSGCIYFLRESEKLDEGIFYFVDKYDYANKIVQSMQIDNAEVLPMSVGLYHTIVISGNGDIYQFGSTENGVTVMSYSNR